MTLRKQQEEEIYQDEEMNLRAIITPLMAHKFLIAGLTIFVTGLAIFYTLSMQPIYKVTSSFTSPSLMSVAIVNSIDLTSSKVFNESAPKSLISGNILAETKNSLFTQFLTKLSSKDLQKLAFIEGDFLTKFNTDNSPIADVEVFISNAILSVQVNPPDVTKKDQDLAFLTEIPYSVSMEGTSADATSEYLNSLVDLANSKTIAELIRFSELKIDNRIEEISIQRAQLLEQAEQDRFSEIERIKEKDGQKIRQINDQIDRARYKAKENRLNQIVVLIDSAKLAKSLGIIENNFKLINDDGAKSDLTIAIGESKDLPEWYLYGEKALIQRVELLENRMSDDPFIPELVTLNNQLNEVQNNNLLKTLETRQDDGPFIPEIVTLNNQLNEVQNNNALKTLETRQDDSPFVAEIINLDIEKIKLKSRIVSMNDVNAMKLSQISIPPKSPIKPNKRMIVLLAFIGSFMMSVFLALIMGALKPDEKAPTA